MLKIYRFPSVTLSAIAQASLEATASLSIESVERFTGVLDRVRDELETVGRDQEVWVVAPSAAEEKRLGELLAESAPARTGRLHFARGYLSGGFRLVPEKLVLVSSAELFRREDVAVRAPRHRLGRAIDTFLDLHEGDFVVHASHGVGRYRGLKLLEQQDRTEEFLELEFAESTRIYVPVSCIELVQKYVGGSKLARGGQVFFVHNRIHDIHTIAHRLEQIMPGVRIGIGHGRLSETELEEVMLDFVAGKTQILLATTIIESGLDIPNANTIFIDEADTYGLADLHQLRGRVGRSHHRAYCYLLVDEMAQLTSTAARRLRAIQEFSSMGAGFSLAMRDLEIRGPGEFLGARQSGAPLLRFADLASDTVLLEWARGLAPRMLERHAGLARKHVARWLGGKSEFLKA